MIAAMAANRVIGRDNDLPWHLPDDMKYFMQTTKGHAVIMGRRNYESIPEKFRPLPGRMNIVLSRDPGFKAPGCTIARTPQAALEAAATFGKDEIFIIGGAAVYELFLPLSSKLYLTEVDASPAGDVFFPEFSKEEWIESSRSHHPGDERHAWAFD